jgi:DNA-binding NarL/FixJ family response regulator
MIVDCISKGENISGIRILCNWDIIHRGTSSLIQNEFNFENQYSHSNSGCFYEDSELMEMMRVETLLSSSDKTDLEIIEAILCGKETAEIEESCFLTETSVKYRIKKMKEICLVNSRAELKALLSNYLPEGNLQILLS